MTARWRFAIVREPRRWDAGSPAAPRSSAGAGGCSPMPRPVGGQTSRAPVLGSGLRRSRPPSSRTIGGLAIQASCGRRRRPGRAFLAPRTGVQVMASGRERAQAWTPCPSSPPRAASRSGARRVGNGMRGDSAPGDDAIKTLTDRHQSPPNCLAPRLRNSALMMPSSLDGVGVFCRAKSNTLPSLMP